MNQKVAGTNAWITICNLDGIRLLEIRNFVDLQSCKSFFRVYRSGQNERMPYIYIFFLLI